MTLSQTVHALFKVAHAMGIALSRNDVTQIMLGAHTNPKFGKRLSDLKRDGKIQVIGFKKCPYSDAIVQVYARTDYIDANYFGSSILDSNTLPAGIIKCSSCHKPTLDQERVSKISSLVTEISKNGTSSGKALIKLLFPDY